MLDLNKLEAHVDRLKSLLADRHEGTASWCQAVIEQLEAIGEMWKDYNSGIKWIPYKGEYEKREYIVRTKSGKVYCPCWPYAGDFYLLSRKSFVIKKKDIADIATRE
jgi:hypothetical protein